MKGTILKTGMIKGDDGKIYSPDMIHGDTILLAYSSWTRKNIEDVKGKRVWFDISPSGKGYNFGVLDKKEEKIIKV